MTSHPLYLLTAEELDKLIDQRASQIVTQQAGLTLLIDGTNVPVMTSAEVTKVLEISDTTLWRYEQLPIDSPKHLSPIKHNNRKYYKRDDIDRFRTLNT